MPPPAPAPAATRKTGPRSGPRSQNTDRGKGVVVPPGTPPFLMSPEEALRECERRGREAESSGERSEWTDVADFAEEACTSREGEEQPGPLADDAGPKTDPDFRGDDTPVEPDGTLADGGAPSSEEVTPAEGEGGEPIGEEETPADGEEAPGEDEKEADGTDGDGGDGLAPGEAGDVAVPAEPDTGAGGLATGDLVLIDFELAEHQRWDGALGRVGAAGSVNRAEFVAEAAGSGFISGAASGLAMGLGIGLVTRAVPAIGPLIGGAMALHGLATRDWAETGATIGKFGEGNSTYETLANTIASVAAVIDVVSQVLTVINGIVGIVQIAALAIAGGAVILAFVTFGATAGIAIVAGEVAATCEEISLGINAVTTVLDTVNAAILQPCVTLFRALHTFTTEADPREVESQGQGISTAAAASGAALGAWAGGRAAQAGGAKPRPEIDVPPHRPAHETPPPAAGDGPTVHFSEPPAPVVHAEGAPAPVAHAEGGPEPRPAIPPPGGPDVPIPDIPKPPLLPNIHEPPIQVPEGPVPGVNPYGPTQHPPVDPLGPTQAPPPASHPEAAPAPVAQAEAAPSPVPAADAAPPPAAHPDSTSTPASSPGEQVSFPGMEGPPVPAGPPPTTPLTPQPHPITPDVEIRGDFSDTSLKVVTSDQSGRAALIGEVGPHQWQGNRGGGVRESEHAIPGAQMRDASRDPAHGNAPDWQRHAPQPDPTKEASDGRDYNRATSIIEHSVVSDRKTAMDNPVTRALTASGGARNPVEDLLLPSLARHQQAVDDAIAAGEITPAQATDPTHRALAALAEMWGGSEATGGAKARADAEAAGTSVPNPRRPDRARAAEKARAEGRLAGEHIEEPDWDATFPNPNRLLPAGTQLGLPGMEHLAPRPAGPAPEQLALPGVSQHATDPNQASLPFDGPPPTTPSPPKAPPPGGEPQRILVVGAERAAEFEYATQMAAAGNDVTVVNPQATPQSAAFSAAGGKFVEAGIETLPQKPGFHVVSEDFPVPIRRMFPQARAMATERISRLEPGGRWTVTTESSEFVGMLQLVGGMQGANVTAHQVPRHHEATPDSPHVVEPTRFIVIVERPNAPPAPAPSGGEPPAGPPRATPTPTVFPPPTAAPPHPTTPPATPTTRPPPTTTPRTLSNFSAAAGAARTAVGTPAPGGPQPGTESPSFGTRAHQVGELFLPQVFGAGGTPPTYAQQQATHRERFTADNQPAEGIERVNPNYPPPPATPAQISAIQNEIVNLLAVRASAEREEQNQSQRADSCEENQAPIEQTVQDASSGISALQAHDEAIARRETVNQEQQQRQQESQGLTAGYPSRATGLAALTVPLAAWEGFTSLAQHLPGDAGAGMMRMNQEAQQMQEAFDQMGAEMLGVDSEGPVRQGELEGDQASLEATGEMAQASDEQLQTASEGAAGLQAANEASLAEATELSDAAAGRADQCEEGVSEREERADSLAAQLQAWASAHQAARQQAVQAAQERLVSEGRIVLKSSGT